MLPYSSRLSLALLTVLTCAIASPAFAIRDFDNSVSAADFVGNLNSGTGFRTIQGDVTATDDLEDFKQILLTGRSNLRLNLEGVAPDGGRTDLTLVQDKNRNGRLDSGEIIAKSRNSFSHQITRQNLTAGNYIIIIASRQLNSSKVRYKVTVDARV
ncbi:hypothetical protein IJ00_24685 [Calothrix sp. 336/3]|nr:hypothetical protein IJ00_24685 [Calothrix sp. 336/3]